MKHVKRANEEHQQQIQESLFRGFEDGSPLRSNTRVPTRRVSQTRKISFIRQQKTMFMKRGLHSIDESAETEREEKKNLSLGKFSSSPSKVEKSPRKGPNDQ